jgi:hypothetical protein
VLVSGPYRQTKKLPRYLKQRDHYSCGAIALLNTLKWAGYQVSYQRDFKRACRTCKCTKEGMFDHHFDTAIRRYKKLVVLPDDGSFHAPPIKLVDECLDSGGAVVISFIYKYQGIAETSHIALCIGRKGKRYLFANNSAGAKKALIYQRRSTVVKMLRFSENGCGSEVWFLDRLDNKTLR